MALCVRRNVQQPAKNPSTREYVPGRATATVARQGPMARNVNISVLRRAPGVHVGRKLSRTRTETSCQQVRAKLPATRELGDQLAMISALQTAMVAARAMQAFA